MKIAQFLLIQVILNTISELLQIFTSSKFPFLLKTGFRIDFLHNYHMLGLENMSPGMVAARKILKFFQNFVGRL